MKKLFLIRHAKSDWSIPGLGDFDRPLNQRGYVDAHKVAAHIKQLHSGSTLFVSSPAVRALSTALIFARNLKYPLANISMYHELYEAEPDVYMELINSLDDSNDTVFIFGHNPTISLVVSMLTESDFTELPTCAVSIIQFNIGRWSEALLLKGKLENQVFPKALTT